MGKLVLKIENVSKHYKLGVLGTGSLKEDVKNWFNRKFNRSKSGAFNPAFQGENDLWALKNVSFEVYKGEVIGLVGKNGSGKSTLLKILSRVILPTTGRIRGVGKISSLLEVGTGFHGELTGRENIYLNGQILGLSTSQLEERYDEIVAFSGIEKFLETPVKRYSSGMYVRLAFAVAAHLQSDILIVDEVLAVGDSEFQMKCIEKMRSIAHDEGRTVFFVSHNLQTLKKLCTRIIFLNKGEIIASGNPDEVINKYLKHDQINAFHKRYDSLEEAPGNEYVKIKEVELLPQYLPGSEIIDIRTPLLIKFEFWYVAPQNAAITVSIVVFNLWGDCIFEVNSKPRKFKKGLVSGSCIIPDHVLNDNSYSVSIAFIEDNQRICYTFESCLQFDIDNYIGPEDWPGNWIGYIRPDFPVEVHQD